MTFRVAATPPNPTYAFEHEHEALDPLGAEIVPVRYETDAQYGEAVADADAIIIGRGVTVSAATIGRLRACKIIVNGGVGVDRIDVDAATETCIPVVNVPDVWITEVANQAMLLLLASARKLIYTARVASTARWSDVYDGLGSVPRLESKTLGLIAFGNIARQVAKRARAFDLRVVAHDPAVPLEVMREHGVEARSLEDLLRESDFVSAHAPHTSGTHHLMSDAQFALMKPTAIFVNTGRGRVVDERALIAALERGAIAGAGLDVLEQEPPDPANPLLAMPNVLVTPHVAYFSDEAFVASRRRVGQEVAAVLGGRRPRNVVNPVVLERLPLA